MEVSLTTLEQARRANAAECEHTLAAYRRLFARFERLREQLGELGLACPGKPPPPEKLAQKVETTFAARSRDGIETVHHLYQQKGGLENLIQEAEARIQGLATDVQQGLNKLAQEAEAISKGREGLAGYVREAVPTGWPHADKSCVDALLRGVLEKLTAPETVEVRMHGDTLRKLQQARGQATRALADLVQGKRAVEAAVQKIHTRRVAERNAEHSRQITNELSKSLAAPKSIDEFFRETAPVTKPNEAEDKTLSKLEKLFVDIAMLRPSGVWAELEEKAREIRSERGGAERQMRYEALVVECGTLIKVQRELGQWRTMIEGMIDRAAHVQGPAVQAIVAELESLLRAGRVVDLKVLGKRLEAAIQEEEKRREREQKRRAVLESLAALGYEVEEGSMQTALVQAGKVLIRKPDEEEYAVELVANTDFSLFQTTLVRFADTKEVSAQQRLRDKEHDETWCSDHARMREALDRVGLASEFKMKFPVGHQPATVIVDPTRIGKRRKAKVAVGRQARAS